MLLVTPPPLPPTSWLTSCLCATCPSDVGIKPAPRAYIHWYYFDLKVTWRAGDYITGNTSCFVLNFAWPHWPGYSFIIYGNVGSGRTRAQSYLKNRGRERGKKKVWKMLRSMLSVPPLDKRARGWLLCAFMPAHVCVNSVSPRAKTGQHKRRYTQTIRESGSYNLGTGGWKTCVNTWHRSAAFTSAWAFIVALAPIPTDPPLLFSDATLGRLTRICHGPPRALKGQD